MKKKAFLFATLILPLFSLSACGEATFGYRCDDIPTIDQNGDLLVYTSSTNLKYKNVTVAGNIEAYRNDIASNQDFFLLFTRDTCSHCLDLEPSFVDFALKSRLKIYSDPITDQEAMKSWASSYGEGSDMSSISENLATPVIHLVKANNGKPEAIYKNFYASTSSGKMLSEFFIKQLNRTNIYHFETLEGIVAFRKDNKQALYYFTSGTDDTFYRLLISGWRRRHRFIFPLRGYRGQEDGRRLFQRLSLFLPNESLEGQCVFEFFKFGEEIAIPHIIRKVIWITSSRRD